ncbi:glycosyltransferase family 39 protein [Candidatus Fermentibacteria bacterium]|nr:glycosyltransferase family 39 protein [Candidatus Fermentibacteria bacterium]
MGLMTHARSRTLRTLGAHWGLVAGLLITAGAGIATLRQPEFGDGQAYMIPNALHMMRTFDPFIEDEVHPPFFFLLEGIAFRLFGPHVETAHALSVVFSMVMVAAVYGLGAGLAGSSAGSMAALLVAAWPPFLVQTTLVRLDIPVAALSILTLLAAHRGWPAIYLLAGALAPLTKAPGILAPAVLSAMGTLGLWRPRFRQVFLWVPVIVYAAWLVACKVRFGWFLYPENVEDFSLLHNVRAGLDGWVYWVRRLVVDQWAWVPFSAAVLLGVRRGWRMAIPLAVCALCVVGAAAMPRMGAADGAAVGLFVVVAALCWARGGFWRIVPLLALALTLLFCTYHYRFPRYMLPAWPGLAICSAAALVRRRAGWPIVAVSAGLMISAAFSAEVWKMDKWSVHESTLGYRGTIRAHKAAIDYLRAAAGDLPIVAAGKAAEALSVPALGYVHAPLRVVGLTEGCDILRQSAYYLEISTRDRVLEKRVWPMLRSCGVRANRIMAEQWDGPYGEGTTGVYRLGLR